MFQIEEIVSLKHDTYIFGFAKVLSIWEKNIKGWKFQTDALSF